MAAKLKNHLVRAVSELVTRLNYFKRAYEPSPSVAVYVKDDAIGDFLFGTAMIRELKARYSDVYLICQKNLRPIAELYLPAKYIIGVDVQRFNNELAYRLSCLKEWRALGPSLVVTSSLRSSFADQVAKYFRSIEDKNEPVTIVSTDDPATKKKRRSCLYTRLGDQPPDTEIDIRYLCGAHRKEHLLIEAAFESQFEPSQTRPYVSIDQLPHPEEFWRVEKFGVQPTDYFCVLPSAGDIRRVYPQKDLIELAKRVAKQNRLTAVFLSAEPIGDLADRRDSEVLDLTTKTSIMESLALVAKARFSLTNETGLGHASWIMGRPTVMIMPGGNFHHFHAGDERLHAVYDLRECFDCHHNCRYKFETRFPCIDGIPLEKIERTISAVLGK